MVIKKEAPPGWNKINCYVVVASVTSFGDDLEVIDQQLRTAIEGHPKLNVLDVHSITTGLPFHICLDEHVPQAMAMATATTREELYEALGNMHESGITWQYHHDTPEGYAVTVKEAYYRKLAQIHEQEKEGPGL